MRHTSRIPHPAHNIPHLTSRLLCSAKENALLREQLAANDNFRRKQLAAKDKQIEELTEAIVLPMTHKERFINIGIRPPKGLLMHGPPGTGKTLMARACAA